MDSDRQARQRQYAKRLMLDTMFSPFAGMLATPLLRFTHSKWLAMQITRFERWAWDGKRWR